VHGRAEGGRLARDRIVQRITLAGNAIINPPGAGISVGAAQDVVLAENSVHFGEGALLDGPKAAVELANVEGVRVLGLEVTGARSDVAGGVYIDASSAPGHMGVRIAHDTISLPVREDALPVLTREGDRMPRSFPQAP
jgi:hypothetical protein